MATKRYNVYESNQNLCMYMRPFFTLDGNNSPKKMIRYFNATDKSIDPSYLQDDLFKVEGQ